MPCRPGTCTPSTDLRHECDPWPCKCARDVYKRQQQGSDAAFTELFLRYRERVYGFFRRRMNDAAQAEELAQETFLAVLRAAQRYEPDVYKRQALKLASIISIAGPLDSLAADLKIFPQKIVNVRVRSKPPLDSLPEVARVLGEAEKALGNSGRVVLRYSGTEPLARVMVEAERDEDVRRWTESLATALRTTIGV